MAKEEPTAENAHERDGELYEFAYGKYGQHIVAIRCEGGGRELFDVCKLFMKADTRVEYERIKDIAAHWAKQFVETHNAGLRIKNHGK